MWELLRQRWHVLPNDWKLAFIVLILSSVIFPAVWQGIKVVMNIPNMMYKRVIIKMHKARIEWFQAKGPQAPPPTDNDLIAWAHLWPWLAKRALRIQSEKIITYDLDH